MNLTIMGWIGVHRIACTCTSRCTVSYLNPCQDRCHLKACNITMFLSQLHVHVHVCLHTVPNILWQRIQRPSKDAQLSFVIIFLHCTKPRLYNGLNRHLVNSTVLLFIVKCIHVQTLPNLHLLQIWSLGFLHVLLIFYFTLNLHFTLLLPSAVCILCSAWISPPVCSLCFILTV